MRILLSIAIALLLVTIGCGGSSTTAVTPAAPPAAQARSYSGTASVGDFLALTVDASAHTITYRNVSNGDNGTASYTVNSNGTYTITDPSGNLVSAYEVPNYALLIEATKTGPDHNTPSIITAVTEASISLDTWKNQKYNYIQFRTSSGGMEVGSVSLDAQGNATVSHYWPYGALNTMDPSQAFGGSTMLGSDFHNGPTGTYLTLTEDNGGTSYIFGTANGVFAVDTTNGAILGFEKAATKDFDPTVAGTYNAVYYLKKNANTGMGNVETGIPTLNHATVTVTSAGHLTAVDPQGVTLLDAPLTPVADASYLYDGTGSKLDDPCYGLFTFRIVHGGATQDTFVTFVNGAMLFSLYSSASDAGPGYDYVYGVGLK